MTQWGITHSEELLPTPLHPSEFLVTGLGGVKSALYSLLPTTKCLVRGRPQDEARYRRTHPGHFMPASRGKRVTNKGTQRPIPNTPESRRGTKKLVPDGYDELDKRHDVIDQCGQRCT